jgi:hypothetical protein
MFRSISMLSKKQLFEINVDEKFLGLMANLPLLSETFETTLSSGHNQSHVFASSRIKRILRNLPGFEEYSKVQ